MLGLLSGFLVPHGVTDLAIEPRDGLEEKRYVTALLRLLLDANGELAQGEIADVEGSPSKRFVGWDGLVSAVRAWLVTMRPDAPRRSHE